LLVRVVRTDLSPLDHAFVEARHALRRELLVLQHLADHDVSHRDELVEHRVSRALAAHAETLP
jgi:hypothetical protein